jgi:hypothetical protein
VVVVLLVGITSGAEETVVVLSVVTAVGWVEKVVEQPANKVTVLINANAKTIDFFIAKLLLNGMNKLIQYHFLGWNSKTDAFLLRNRQFCL